MNIVILVSIGILIEILNSLALKWTVKKIVEYKNAGIAVFSFFTRMAVICTLFYYFMDGSWKNAVFMLLGLTISKIFFIILEKKKGIKK